MNSAAEAPAALRRETGFFEALLRLPENPLAIREWRALRHQARDWRLWLGLRIPKDARGWGVPAIAWFFLAPYIVWGALTLGRRAAPAYFTFTPVAGLPSIDILGLCFTMLAAYPALVAAALMSSAISAERERESLDDLRAAMGSPHDLLLGLLAGRVGPVLLSFTIIGALWVVARPHYAPLLQSFTPFTWSAPQLALAVAASLALTVATGTIAAAASTRLRRSGQAMLAGFAAAAVLTMMVSAALLVKPGGGAAAVIVGVLPVIGAAYVVALRGL